MIGLDEHCNDSSDDDRLKIDVPDPDVDYPLSLTQTNITCGKDTSSEGSQPPIIEKYRESK